MRHARISLFWKLGLSCLILLLLALSAFETRRGGSSATPILALIVELITALITGILIWIFPTHPDSKRLARLKEFTRRIAAGDFRPLPEEQHYDEISELTKALNEMAARRGTTVRSLEEQRDRFTAVLRSMVEGVAVIDTQERITFCNDAFAEVWGARAAACEGKTIVEVVRQPDILTVIRKAIAGEKRVQGEISLGSARPRSFSVTAALIPMPKGVDEAETGRESRHLGEVIVLHEITELRKIEQVRKDFVANVSHELRTPLTAIQGFAETLLGGALEDSENNRRFVEIIRSHAARLGRLTDDLLKLSRIEAGKLEPEVRPMKIEELLEAGVEVTRIAAKPKQLALSLNMHGKLPAVRGDANQLREVVRNLLDNAVQYTPAGGKIQVSAAVNDGFVDVTVADTGIGIPHAEQSRIFERFFRVDAARSREVGGTGLGLSIAKHIVESHGGRIWVESTVGEGSKFHFSVPVAN